MNQAVTHPVASKNSVGKFLTGFRSGAFSGALMMGIVGVVSLFTPLGFTLGIAASTALCTGLFSGTMSVIRGNGHQASAPVTQQAPRTVRAPAQGISQERAPEQAVSASVTPEQTTTKWADKVGQRHDRVQQILDRDMSDQSRASALLAERENAANAEVAR